MNLKPLLIIGTTWPEPQATAAGGRMQRLMEFFLSEGYQITFASTASESPLSLDLASLGIHKQSILLNHKSFDDFIITLQPEVVLFDRFPMEEQFGWRVAEFVPKAIRILDTEDLHSLRKTREAAFKSDIIWNTAFWLQADITKREIASIYRSDLSLIISSFEMELLLDVVRIDANLVFHLPFMRNGITQKNKEAWPPFEERSNFLCIGNGKHTPNVDALIWLKKEVWPLIRKTIPDAKLNVYGAYLPEHVEQMHNQNQGFLIHGWAESKQEVFQKARINLAPLRFGAGLKGKLIDAMLVGTPSITTSIGAEGMHDNLEWCGEIAEDSAAFAQKAIDLYHDKERWQKAQQNGIAIVNELHNKEKEHARLHDKIQFLKQHLESHRIQNFTGSMLQQQTIASTKYMAKWIAEKNRS